MCSSNLIYGPPMVESVFIQPIWLWIYFFTQDNTEILMQLFELMKQCPYKGNTNDVLLTGLTYRGNPHKDILKIWVTTYDLRLTGYGLYPWPYSQRESVLKMSDDSCSEGRCTLSLATTTVIDSVIHNYTLFYSLPCSRNNIYWEPFPWKFKEKRKKQV